jgi:hypothetical protein
MKAKQIEEWTPEGARERLAAKMNRNLKQFDKRNRELQAACRDDPEEWERYRQVLEPFRDSIVVGYMEGLELLEQMIDERNRTRD